MSKQIIIDGNFPNQYRVALVNAQNKIDEFEYETANSNNIKGNIYLAKVVRIEPGLQAAFVDYGSGKNGFLPFSEIHPDYYNIQINDKKFCDLQAVTPPESVLSETQEEVSDISLDCMEKEIDIAQIEKFLDEETNPELAYEASDVEIDKLSDEKIDLIPDYKNHKIQDVIKKNQIVLVQAQKEERGNKGASFSTYISIAGKYCVLMPNSTGHHGISRRISSGDERRRLRDTIAKLINEKDSKHASVILRTASIGKTFSEIIRDYEYLARLWNRIREVALKSKAPSFVHAEEGIIQKTIRDLYDTSVKQIIVDGKEAHDKAIDFMKYLLPKDVSKIKLHKNLIPAFSQFKIEDQVASLYQQFVPLPSGGYIVINPTEALTSIDVNSGRSISEKNIEETALKTNVEATKEIARQFKLRDISGLIVIDFIDMYESRNRRIVERSLKEYMSRDRAKIQIGHISTFGLFEMSRQRLRPSFLEAHTVMCTHCNGKGIVRDQESNSMLILRTVENEIYNQDSDIVNIYANINVVIYLLNHKRDEIFSIESKYGVKLNFLVDKEATSDSFSIEKITLPTHAQEDNNPNNNISQISSEETRGNEMRNEIRKEATKKVIRELSEEPSKNTKKEEYTDQDKSLTTSSNNRRRRWKDSKHINERHKTDTNESTTDEVAEDKAAKVEEIELVATKPKRKNIRKTQKRLQKQQISDAEEVK